MGEKVAIVGSKNYNSPSLVREYISRLAEDDTVVSGGAPGVDTWAEEAAEACGLETLIFHADWENLGRKAGPIRNEKIVAQADQVIAFWNKKSRGTLNTVVLANEKGIPVKIFSPDGESIPLEEAMKVAEERGVVAAIEAGRGRNQKK